VPLTRLLRLIAVGSLDKLGSLVGRPPIYLTASAAAGEFGVIASKDAIEGLPLITPLENQALWIIRHDHPGWLSHRRMKMGRADWVIAAGARVGDYLVTGPGV
jgi:hypothetical protein